MAYNKQIFEQIFGLLVSDMRRTPAGSDQTQAVTERPEEDARQVQEDTQQTQPEKEQKSLETAFPTPRRCQAVGNRHQLRQGMIMAVVLGPPRSLAPYRRGRRPS
ncbi:MAG: hypothetical protein GX162_11580 [Firmicutes bacterium]|nr:hypothetical protein [Bacillota bacterium]